MDTLTTDLSKVLQAENESDSIARSLNDGHLVSSEAISDWLRQQDPLNETAAVEYVTAVSLLSKNLIKEVMSRRGMRTQTFRAAGYLTAMRAYFLADVQESSLEEHDAITTLQTNAAEYYDRISPKEKDVAMSAQDIVLHSIITKEPRADIASTKLLIMSTHLLYDALTDSIDMIEASQSRRQTITYKDGLILARIGKHLNAHLPNLLQSGDLDTAFSAAQASMMVESYFLNQYSHPSVKTGLENKDIAKKIFLNLKDVIDTMLPYVDTTDPRQLGKLYEMVWLYDAHALKYGLSKDRLSIWPTNIAKDEPYIGKPKKKRNVDVVFWGDKQDNRMIRIQLKAKASNRNKAKKSKHPDVYISPDGEDFDSQFVTTLPDHLNTVTRAALSKKRQLLHDSVMPTVLDTFREYDQTQQTTVTIGAGVLAFVQDNPQLQNGLSRILQVQDDSRLPNRAQRRANARNKR